MFIYPIIKYGSIRSGFKAFILWLKYEKKLIQTIEDNFGEWP